MSSPLQHDPALEHPSDPDQIGRTGGRPRRSGGFARLIGKALGKGWMRRADSAKGSGERPHRAGGGRGYPQRVVVKALVVWHGGRRRIGSGGDTKGVTTRGGASLSRHVRYLGRDGTSEQGERGQFYDRGTEGLDAAALTRAWHDDPHHFRFIVSPEKGEQIADLTGYVREVMGRVERDLRSATDSSAARSPADQLEWLAINHFNTDQPHAHVLVRGVTGPLIERSRDASSQVPQSAEASAPDLTHQVIDPAHVRTLILSRQTISHGIRRRAEEVATELLGERSLQEVCHAREQEVAAERWTGLDRQIARQIAQQSTRQVEPQRDPARATPEGTIDVAPDLLQGVSGHERGLLVRRLQTLQSLGLARPARSSAWRVEPDFRDRLLALGARGDVIRTLYVDHGAAAHAWAGRVIPFGLAERLAGRAPSPLEGVVVEHGVVDELTLDRYLVVRDRAGQDHYATVREGDAYDRVQKGASVILGRSAFERDQGVGELLRVAESSGERVYSIEAHRAVLSAQSDLTQRERQRLLDFASRQLDFLAGRVNSGVERAPDGTVRIEPGQLRDHARRMAVRSTTDLRVVAGGRDLDEARTPEPVHRQRSSRAHPKAPLGPGRSVPVPVGSRGSRSRDGRDEPELG